MTMKRIYLSPPHLGTDEQELLLEALDSNWIAPLGPQVDAFERELAEAVGVEHALALSSGTAGLHLALLLLGVGPGDEVLVSSLTFVASANVVRYVGATPVFVDSEAASWNLDPGLLEAELEAAAARGALPKAVLAVDLYGQCADYERIAASCRRFGVPLIEDAAEALGATYGGRPAGSFGDLAVFSFNGNKIITTSGGGMLVSRRRDWIDEARFLSTQARDDAPHYQHSRMGFNYRMSNLLAAVGRGQLRQLPHRVARRREHNAFYRDALGDIDGIEFMPEAPSCRSTFWLTTMTVDPDRVGCSRERIRERLEAANIEARPVWKPMHLQPLYQSCRVLGGAVSEKLFETGLCLPSGSNLSDADRRRVVEEVRAAIESA